MKNKKIIIILLLIMILSIINNYYARFILSSYNNYYLKQIVWFSISFGIIYLISKINLDYIFKYSLWFYLLGLFLLIITLLFGSNINGATSWLRIGPASFQPSEFMKIALILYLRYFTLKYNLSDFKYLIITFIIVLIPSVLTFLEPDTGAVLIYFIIYLVFLFLRKLNRYYYIVGFTIIGLFLTTFLVLYYGYQDLFINTFGTSFFYRMDRITNFFNNDGYQISRALSNISSCGLFGSKKIIYFPEAPTDFAFTLFISNFGIVGLLILLTIYLYFFYYLSKIKNDKYLLYPLLYILLFQYIVNVLMNLGLFPIIGMPLPLFSYGGSSLLSFMILIGFLLKKSI